MSMLFYSSALKAMIVDDQLFSSQLVNKLKVVSPDCYTSECASIEHAVEAIQSTRFQYLFVDVQLLGIAAKGFIIYCKRKYPFLIVIVSSNTCELVLIRETFKWGINGFINKSIATNDLSQMIELTKSGHRYLSPDLTKGLSIDFFEESKNLLTEIEREFIHLIASGLDIKKIGSILLKNPYVIMEYKNSIMRKLDLKSIDELKQYAFENNLN